MAIRVYDSKRAEFINNVTIIFDDAGEIYIVGGYLPNGKDVVYNEEELETIGISGDIEMNVDLLPNRDNIF